MTPNPGFKVTVTRALYIIQLQIIYLFDLQHNVPLMCSLSDS